MSTVFSSTADQQEDEVIAKDVKIFRFVTVREPALTAVTPRRLHVIIVDMPGLCTLSTKDLTN